MRWQHKEESSNVEDRRGQRSGFGGRTGFPIKGKGSILLLVVVMVAGFYGIDLTPLLEGGSALVPTQTTQAPTAPSTKDPNYQESAQEKELAKLSKVLLKTTEETWDQIFMKSGQQYRNPTMVLYTGSTPTACGYGQSAMGPFYCPEDNKLYLDLSFYRDMQTKLGGGGDFALGYVLAHEVGHHVQNLLGIAGQVRQLQAKYNGQPAKQNALSVRLELQADCLAGVWGKFVQKKGLLEQGDLEKALNTAMAIGDDRLQRQSMGRVIPDSFTHGSSEQRLYWFKKGFETGNPAACNTFESSR